MNQTHFPLANPSSWRCPLAAVLAVCLPVVCPAALVFNVGDHFDVSADAPAITLFLQNSGATELRISGAELFFTIQAGGPTVDTSGSLTTSLDLLTGTVFGAAGGFGQYSGSPFEDQRQVWALFGFPNYATIGAGESVTLGTLTFNSFPEGRPYDLSFAGTRFINNLGSEITDFDLTDGTITIGPGVPLPEAPALVAAVFALLMAGFHCLNRRRT